jgi:uncharacterized phage protein gp47/JayE
MATLNTKSFSQLVQGFSAGVQARSPDLVDFSVGSILRAVAEADAANALWLQALIVQVLAVTRAQTSSGPDLDTFVGQFGLSRLGATFATGLVTLSRNTVSATAPFIPVGSILRTADGSQRFAVYADTSNTAYSAVLGGYTMPANVASVSVPVAAVNGGAQGNVASGAISLIASTFPSGGVDAVVNPAAFTNGVDGESDDGLRTRVMLWFNALSKATVAALTYAILSLQVGLQVAVHEQIDPNGAADLGMVTIFVDDGSGAPPAALVTAAGIAVDAVRAASVRAGVYGATTLAANYTMTIVTAAGYFHPTVVGQVYAAVNAFINALGLETKLPFSQLAAVAYGVPGVTNVTGVTLNSGTADLTPAIGKTIKVGVGAVS